MMLKVGRHLRWRPHLKLIIARVQGESQFLTDCEKGRPHVESDSHPRPLALIGSDAAGSATLLVVKPLRANTSPRNNRCESTASTLGT